jgi:hypothetical protein
MSMMPKLVVEQGVPLWGLVSGTRSSSCSGARPARVQLSRTPVSLLHVPKRDGLVHVSSHACRLRASDARRSVKKRAGFDINEIAPLDTVGRAFTPAFFGHSSGDTFVKPHHTERLHAEYAGDKARRRGLRDVATVQSMLPATFFSVTSCKATFCFRGAPRSTVH